MPDASATLGGIGHSVKRKEDPRFLRGLGKYVDDVKSLEAASQRQDRAGALASYQRLKGSCAACHRQHRPKDE